MNLNALLAVYDAEERRGSPPPGLHQEANRHLARELPDDGSYWIAWSDLRSLSGNQVDTLLAQEAAYARRLGRAVEWKHHGHDAPPDLLERLARHGFRPGEPEALLVADVRTVATTLDAPTRDVRAVGPGNLDALRHVYQVVWPDETDRVLRMIGTYLQRSPMGVHAVAGYQDGEPVSAGWTTYRPGSRFAALWGGATLPHARGQGHYRAVVAARVQEAQRRGRSHALVDAAPTSRPILERGGFHLLTLTTPCLFDPRHHSEDVTPPDAGRTLTE